MYKLMFILTSVNHLSNNRNDKSLLALGMSRAPPHPSLGPGGDLQNPLALEMSEAFHPHPRSSPPLPRWFYGYKKVLSPFFLCHGLERHESSVVACNNPCNLGYFCPGVDFLCSVQYNTGTNFLY